MIQPRDANITETFHGPNTEDGIKRELEKRARENAPEEARD
jgi:hypothetical protein